jgi:hypothetical protein
MAQHLFGWGQSRKGQNGMAADRAMDRPKAPLGSGERFKSLVGQLSKKPGITDPAGLAASIGRKKYGASRFAKLGKGGGY